jgi:hypothetical protein
MDINVGRPDRALRIALGLGLALARLIGRRGYVDTLGRKGT